MMEIQCRASIVSKTIQITILASFAVFMLAEPFFASFCGFQWVIWCVALILALSGSPSFNVSDEGLQTWIFFKRVNIEWSQIRGVHQFSLGTRLYFRGIDEINFLAKLLLYTTFVVERWRENYPQVLDLVKSKIGDKYLKTF